ncbi:gliding motility-associated C-terminal domain-containing protein [Flavobacterium sp. Fl-318]|uniref:Gliding motility-associated C-terminal domain-containing protein n=1 Tax=Flavobacterium cupriresistens TaxID=2893885 RepID=A0ABU4R794_9FLAO|nr:MULTISPECIES: gliding motility-associated C-terminal domain-containing protein [unclassified Flavobacterium]MDX6188464.1 gliding motility-associated C-terminal domain-containing protein [Flavobacterium sp. Fl-318]UFH44865.1 gliding motility-associated C-terminal domain-containing protein [Flavobacterium sp. F-323]
MFKNHIKFLYFILFFVFFSFMPSSVFAQCAGNDGNLTVCDIPNPANQSINLYAALGGTPTAGGVWSDDDETGGLNATTGVLNVHLIRQSGIYHYTYTVNGGAGCTDNSATVTVTIGGYSGITSNSTQCSATGSFNLFEAFNGLFLGPQYNGQWFDNTTNKNVDASINITDFEGDYKFTYTMPAIGSCPAVSSSAVITVVRAPKSGEPIRLSLCASDGLSAYTNFDLYTLLKDQDAGGTWSDSNRINTGELTFSGDHFVDMEKIYDRFGEGYFYFTYRVLSPKPICDPEETIVWFRLEKKLDFTGATLTVNTDICETEIATANYSVTIRKGNAVIPNGSYFVQYKVSGPNGGAVEVIANFTNGVLIFPLDSKFFQQVGSFNVSILDIFAFNSSRKCTNIINNLSDDLVVYAIPDLSDAKITPITTCQNESATVQISDAIKITDGTYDLVYNLTGANTATGQIARATFTAGNASFSLPAILNSNAGTAVLTITNISHVISQCANTANLSGDILINPLPATATVRMQIKDVCFGEPVSVQVSGLGTLTDISLSYTVADNTTSTPLTVSLPVSGGNASFVLPSGPATNPGTYTVSITRLTNNITGCGTNITNLSDVFLINAIPVAPSANPQSFCKADGPTIANLQPNGAPYKWYISETATTPLAATYILKSENYYVRETSSAGCTSEPTMIAVTINDSAAPVLNSEGAGFCGLDRPTIADLTNRTNSPLSVVWYDARVNGNVVSSTTPLVENGHYFGFDFESTTGCISENSLEVVVFLTKCDSLENVFIPDGFSPNGDGVNDSFVIQDIDFLYPSYTLQIFNRYGNEMYKGFKNKPGWDGLNYEASGISSGIAPNGVYFYVLYFNKGNKPPKQGRLYLNR